jgi:hypothetical protein
MVALLVVMVPAAALGTPTQQQFQNYQSPTLGVSIQYPSDWKLLEESNDKLRFIKQEGFVTADLNVEDIDQSDATLPEYANTRVNELRTQRPDFQLLSFEPTMISNDIPAQKVVYTFDREEDGKTNKVTRIWSINEGKIYTLAYIAESSQYDQYLPTLQKMVDSFHIDTNRDRTTQVASGDKSNGDNGDNGDNGARPQPSNGLTININIAHDPIVRGNEQTITVTVSDSDSGDKISGANVKGYVKYVTGHREILSGTTDQNGIFKHPWRISGNANTGTFVVHVDVTADGNKSGSKEKSFQVIAKGLTPDATSNLNRTLNQTDPTGRYECTGDGLSYGSYFDENGLIVGSPCDPVEFCSDKGSTDPVVIDYCQDIWTDVDDCLDGQGNKRYPGCSSEPLPPCPIDAQGNEDCPPESGPIGYCNPGLKIIDGTCGPYVPGEAYCQALGCPGSPPDPSRQVTRTPEPITPTSTPTPTPTPTDYCYLPGIGPMDTKECKKYFKSEEKGKPKIPNSKLTPTPTPTPPVDPSQLARSQPQPQCEFGINLETGLCNTEDIPSKPLAPTPEPTTTPDEEFGTEEEPEEMVEEEPEEVPEEVDGEAEEDNTSEGGITKGENQLEKGNE